MDHPDFDKLEKTEKLIEIVKGYPLLFDLSNKDYKNIRKKDKAWEEIARFLEETEGDVVKRKFKNLRDTFARAIRQNYTKTGQAAKPVKKWAWYDQMLFFKPFLCMATTESNVSTNPKSVEQSSKQLREQDVSLIEQEILETERERSTPKVTPKSSATSKRRRAQEGSSVDTLVNYFENKKKTEFDEIDLLFLAHAKTIKTFSKKRQIHAKMEVAQVIMQHELINIEEQSDSKTSQPCHPNVQQSLFEHGPGPSTFGSSYKENLSEFGKRFDERSADEASDVFDQVMDTQDTELDYNVDFGMTLYHSDPEQLEPTIEDEEPLPTSKVLVLKNESLEAAVQSGTISASNYFTLFNPDLNNL